MSKNRIGSAALSRRDVVKSAAVAGAAMAFPTVVTSTAFGEAPAAAAPAKRITLGFIGVGKMSSGHLGYHTGRPDTEVLAICDVDKTRREHFVKFVDDKYKELKRANAKPCQGYVDYKELLARKDIDAVVIGTPDHWHTTILIEAAKAGKDIYCEKPLTLTIAEAKAAIEAVQKHKVVMQTGSQQRSEGPFRDVVDYIRNGKLGKIKEVFVALGGTHSIPCDLPKEEPASEIDWNRWLGQAAERPYAKRLAHAGELPNAYPFNPGWREFKEFSGGYVTDWGAHHIDITQWALQMDGSGPSEILPPAKEGDNYGVKLIYRGSPAGDEIVVHHVESITDAPDDKNPGKTKAQKNGIMFVGEKGRIFVSRSVKVSEPANILAEPLSEGDKKLPNTGPHREQWLKCIRSRELPVANIVVGAGSVTACHLVNLAYWNRQPMKWDPKTWTFADAKQNEWLTRPRREGFALPDIG
ncbi:Gfo/Idh/MocA family protein [Humisphaera borealis]|uniref:Gfo/Idh/MocA family oxidoreductase n=1 Tax=Humisphaera borealis TaxID=2807512 RepID=A0A7M2X4F0_9BACT|nr:Gfo/Idh/MocA family oxidoreductase [Humisphaera borealis]QOV92499.1 Gfo/Idh/MocA family oxidoreductase [Humisphaera borealis]